MYNVVAGTLANDFSIKTIDTENGKRTVANGTVFIRTGNDRKDVPVRITGWGRNALEMGKYTKGETMHFVGTPSPQTYKNESMEKEILTLGYNVQYVDHAKTLIKEQDNLLRNFIKEKTNQKESDPKIEKTKTDGMDKHIEGSVKEPDQKLDKKKEGETKQNATKNKDKEIDQKLEKEKKGQAKRPELKPKDIAAPAQNGPTMG